jgi:hypothetical protein
MTQPQTTIIDRYTDALDRVVEQLQADYYVLAAVLFGSEDSPAIYGRRGNRLPGVQRRSL